MSWWQTLIVASVSAVIAPFFLWLQQRGQNRRDEQRWKLEAQERRDDAARVATATHLAEVRDVYRSLLRAAYAYRAERSIWAARARVGIESGSTGEDEPLGRRIGVPSTSESLPALQESIGIARLSASSGAMLQSLLTLISATDRVERSLTTRAVTAATARDDWDAFESALGALANECAASLALAEGRERPSFEQVSIGRER